MKFISAVCKTHTNDLKSLLNCSVQQSALTNRLAASLAKMKDYSRIPIPPLLYEVFQRRHTFHLVFSSRLIRYFHFLLQQGQHHISDCFFSEICFECFHQFLVLDSVFSGSPHISDSDISEFLDYHYSHLLLKIWKS